MKGYFLLRLSKSTLNVTYCLGSLILAGKPLQVQTCDTHAVAIQVSCISTDSPYHIYIFNNYSTRARWISNDR